MALILDSVVCDYAPATRLSTVVLDRVSMTVEPGGLTVVLGRTGSGKTTLLRAAAGLLAPVAGSVTVDGRPASGDGAARGAVGLVFQRPEAQFFALSIEEDCAFGPRNLGRSRQEAGRDARDALRAVGLDPDEFGPREPWTLSGGEARRAAIAGVLAMRPRYLLLDEPTAGLDAPGRTAVLDAVASMRETAGVVVVTHDPDTFLHLADQVLVLGAGTTVFQGDVTRFMDELPCLIESGAAEAPEVVAVQRLAQRRGALLAGALTADPALAAERLAAALPGSAR